MDLFKAMEISATGLNAQRIVIQAVSGNLANIQTTRTEEGGPYRRKRVVFSHLPMDQRFSNILSNRIGGYVHLVRTQLNHLPPLEVPPWEVGLGKGGVSAELIEDAYGYRMIHDPSHPDANEQGDLYLPDINAIEEMTNLLEAVRSYEANVTAFNAAKSMALKALEIGR